MATSAAPAMMAETEAGSEEETLFTAEDAAPAEFVAYMEENGYGLHLEHEQDGDERSTMMIYTARNGATTRFKTDFFNAKPYRQARGALEGLRQDYGGLVFTLRKKDEELPVADLFGLLDRIMEEAHKGWTVQRYKGLGEMNPEQLKDTTMNPDTRRLLPVRVRDGADDLTRRMFVMLMGKGEAASRRSWMESRGHEVEADI